MALAAVVQREESIMRIRRTSDGLNVYAVAGTDVVLLGFNLPENKTADLMGFAIRRTDHERGETFWLQGFKRFPSTDPGTPAGEGVSTRNHPIQSFQWADYSVRPGQRFSYEVIALRGTPAALVEAQDVTVEVVTETRDGSDHRIWFNRGAASSQAYVHRFGNRTPDEVGQAAFDWLSRGLFEAYTSFLARADSAQWQVRAALYECHYLDALLPLRDAKRRGADVRIVYDARDAELRAKNEETLDEAALISRARARAANPGAIAHNKFIVLSEKGHPRAVWTGSMNLSVNGIYGQSNVGHWVEDATIAAAYLEYWERLNEDPEFAELRAADDAASSIDAGSIPGGTTALFSPRTGNAQLQRIAGLIGDAKRAAFITLPFGVVATMAPALTRDDGILRCILLDSAGSAASQREALRIARALPNVIAAIGNRIETNALDAWVQEVANPWSTNVEYVHTKYALIDPLGSDPIVVTGSANFSDPSVKSNDENTLVIRGDKRVADIYLGEFRRLFDHHAFRESVKTRGMSAVQDPTPLKDEPADWLVRHFDDGGPGELRRLYFSGSPVA